MLDLAALSAPAVRLCVLAAGVFFLLGLLTGVWKYWHIARSATATAPIYVDLTHRAALLYSFASLLLAQFAALSMWSAAVNLLAVALPLAFFVVATGGYAIHGALRDTENQFLKPHRIGSLPIPAAALHGLMWLLVAAEIGGFGVLLAGAWPRLWP